MSNAVSIVQMVLSSSDVTDIIDDRIFPNHRKQGSDLPSIVYQNVSELYTYNDSGRSKNYSNYDLFLYASTFTQLELLIDAVIEVCELYEDANIDYCQISERDDQFIPDVDIQSSRIEIKVWFN